MPRRDPRHFARSESPLSEECRHEERFTPILRRDCARAAEMSVVHSLSGKTVIAGIGATAFGALPGRSTLSMNVEALRNALADAGVDKDAVDALWLKYPTSKFEPLYGQKCTEAAGRRPALRGLCVQARAQSMTA